MKKKILSLVFTLVLLVGIIAAVGMTASAAENYITNSNFAKTENDIIKNVFFSPNSDGTVNIGVNVDINHLDPRDINNDFTTVGYCYYVNDDNTLHSGAYGGINTLDTVFNFTNLVKNAKPGDKYRIKYYLSNDYYGDYEWEGYNFAFVEVIVPNLTIGEVEAVSTGIAYDGTKGAYAPVFTKLIAKDTDGNTFNYANIVTGEAVYTKDLFINENKLATAPVAGTTYYSSIKVDLYEDGVYDLDYDHDKIVDNFSLTIPGYVVRFYSFMEREMGGFIEIKFTLTTCGHNYDNACDTTCNECSAKRSITHTYSNACDKDCNVCKATRTPADHKWVAATCTKAKTCSVCKTTLGKALGHTYKNVTTKATLTKNGKVENKCSVCGDVKSTTTIYYPKTIKLSSTSYTYNGKVKTPTVTVMDSKGNTLKKDTDYTVKYASGRKNAGKYAVTITFKGNYSGTKTLYFNILPSKTSKITPTNTTTSIKATWNKVTGATGYKVELLNSKGKVLKTATTTKLTYTFKKLSKVTTYKIRVTAYKTIDSKKVYSTASTTITTSTAPAKVTLSTVTAGSKQATPAWKTVSGASGYEVQYSTSSEFKSAKTATVKKGSTKKTTIKKLTKGKKYYFKVRAYKTVDGKKVYGAWSSAKSVKVK